MGGELEDKQYQDYIWPAIYNHLHEKTDLPNRIVKGYIQVFDWIVTILSFVKSDPVTHSHTHIQFTTEQVMQGTWR